VRKLVTRPDGSSYGQVANSADFFWLPTDTPFGNMTLKLMKVGLRVGQANLRLGESYFTGRRSSTPVSQDRSTMAPGVTSLARRPSTCCVALR